MKHLIFLFCLLNSLIVAATPTPYIEVKSSSVKTRSIMEIGLRDGGKAILHTKGRVSANHCDPYDTVCELNRGFISTKGQVTTGPNSLFGNAYGKSAYVYGSDFNPSIPTLNGDLIRKTSSTEVKSVFKTGESGQIDLNAFAITWNFPDNGYETIVRYIIKNLTTGEELVKFTKDDYYNYYNEDFTLDPNSLYKARIRLDMVDTSYGDWDVEEPDTHFFVKAHVQVPEPSTLALLMIGLGTITSKRFFSKRV